MQENLKIENLDNLALHLKVITILWIISKDSAKNHFHF